MAYVGEDIPEASASRFGSLATEFSSRPEELSHLLLLFERLQRFLPRVAQTETRVVRDAFADSSAAPEETLARVPFRREVVIFVPEAVQKLVEDVVVRAGRKNSSTARGSTFRRAAERGAIRSIFRSPSMIVRQLVQHGPNEFFFERQETVWIVRRSQTKTNLLSSIDVDSCMVFMSTTD